MQPTSLASQGQACRGAAVSRCQLVPHYQSFGDDTKGELERIHPFACSKEDTRTVQQKVPSYFLPGYTIPFAPAVPPWGCPHPITPQQLMSHCCAPSVLIQLRKQMAGNMFGLG